MNAAEPSFVEIQPSPARLRQQMVEISKHGFSRSRLPGSIDNLRYLIIDQIKGVTIDSLHPKPSSVEQQEPSASPCFSYDLTPSDSLLRLANRSALRNSSAYVAVSYTWSRDSGWSDDPDEPLDILCHDMSKRRSATPLDVLYRSVAYAFAHGIDAIWIDQECIDQTNPIEKENSIQEMDLVYQESDHPIAVLEFEFQTQAELDVFQSICDDAFFTFDPNQIEVLESVLLTLSEDKWFERAWTLQESVSAGVSMTLLFYAVGLRKSPHFGPTPGEFEISIWDFQNAMVNVRNLVEEGLAAGAWPDDSSAIYVSNCADVLWNCIPTIIPDEVSGSLMRDGSHRQKCNAAQALTFLDDRLNSVFSDRLAILANLCNYDYRIDSSVLELPNSSFAVCALTLAILNGDMSLLVGYQDQKQSPPDLQSPRILELAENARSIGIVYATDDSDMPSNTHGFSWGPRPSARLNSMNYLEENGMLFRLKPATLSLQGLRVCGVLWNVNCTVPVPNTQEAFALRWREEVALQEHESVLDGETRQKPFIQEFIWHLLNEVIGAGLSSLARTMWNFSQPLGIHPRLNFESLTAPLPYSYDTIFGVENPSYDKEEVISRLLVPILSFDPLNEALDRPKIERLLIEQVCTDGSLLCASPLSSLTSSQPPRPYVWFEACNPGDKLFTPVTDLGDGAARSQYRDQAMSWRVLETGQCGDDGTEILHCLGRRRGIWRVDELSHRDYTLD